MKSRKEELQRDLRRVQAENERLHREMRRLRAQREINEEQPEQVSDVEEIIRGTRALDLGSENGNQEEKESNEEQEDEKNGNGEQGMRTLTTISRSAITQTVERTRRYQCPYCSKSYADNGAYLSKHVANYHPAEPQII
eukprot:CAMPEP_0202713880 /NCGR_PEP_ID=MMETSP1385-20130828/60983_1 /ASSEMBLY_ACC=CAM_ASM_000861 /TAXON_ID=933848 /ORGANISM="Elphidium margaritaceum" /LENGTH=138 /DNA_ID=CAMNT_0049374421 /DNA_START=114 /DNA_END=530 /DNA_ORIENTATION=+